jgi:predicted amidophosphoribosyltransferase
MSKQTLLICPMCKNTLASGDDKFCYRDGTEMVPRDMCTCGRNLSPHDKYCPKCGKKVERS